MRVTKIFLSLRLVSLVSFAGLVTGLAPTLGIAQVTVSAPSPSPSPTELDLSFLNLPAQDIEQVIEEKPDSGAGKIKVGDEIKLRIQALSLPGVTNPSKDLILQVPAGTESLTDQGWELIPDTAPKGADVVSEFRFRAVPLKAGRLILPSLALVPDGKPVSNALARTNPFTIEVESAVAADDPKPEEAVELRPPVSLRFPLWVIAVGVVLFLGLIAGSVFAYRRYRSRKPKALPAAPAEPPRPEDEVALAALAALERSGPLKRGEFKAHYFGISEILKTYLGTRYRVDAVESTTREMIAALEERRSIGDPQLDRLETIFAKLDLVKFTDHVPLPDEGLTLLQSARELVMMTRRPPLTTTTAMPGVSYETLENQGKGPKR